MKRIEAIIQPLRLFGVKDALKARFGLGMTIVQAQGVGNTPPVEEHYRGDHYEEDKSDKVMIVLYVADEIVDDVCDTILKHARTGKIGDGKIVISEVCKVIRIRDGKTGDMAISETFFTMKLTGE
jgi:nitrogen regulatory protein PII